jgi:hypothetical protein
VPINKAMNTLRRFVIVLVAIVSAKGQSDTDIQMIRLLQWFQSVVQSSVPLASHSKAEVTLEVKPEPDGGDALAGVVESSKIRVSLVLPDGQRIDEKDAGSTGIPVERTHHPGASGLTLVPELFPDRDVVTFTLPKGSRPGKYRIEADGSDYAKDSVLVGAHLPTLRLNPESDDVSISVMDIGASSPAARGCPNVQIIVTVTAVCGDRYCSNLNLSATAQSKDTDKKKRELQATALKENTHSKRNQAFASVLFPELPAGDYDLTTTVRVERADGPPIVRETHANLTIPSAKAAIRNIREVPQHRNESGRFEGLEITAEVELETPGDYEFVLHLLPESGGHIVEGKSRQQFSRAGIHEMTVSIPGGEMQGLDGDGPYLMLDPRLYLREGGAEERVCVAHLGQVESTRRYSLADFESRK